MKTRLKCKMAVMDNKQYGWEWLGPIMILRAKEKMIVTDVGQRAVAVAIKKSPSPSPIIFILRLCFLFLGK